MYTVKEYGVVLVFFGCLAACIHGDLLAEQRGLTEQISTATSKTIMAIYIYRSLSNYLPSYSVH